MLKNLVENLALAVSLGPIRGMGRKSDDEDRVWCGYCNKSCHMHDTCCKIHGKLENWKDSRGGKFKKNPTTHETSLAPFNKEHIDQLLELLKCSSGSFGAPKASVALLGSDFKALSYHYIDWIIDSGASYHTTSLSSLFHSYYPCFGHEK